MAEGGIVTRPTLAVIGEAGPEAVIPLGRGGAGTSISFGNINISGGTEEQIVGQFRKLLREAMRGIPARR
jgi:phage-related minor tail protein